MAEQIRVPDVLVVSYYRAECQMVGCDWEGTMLSDLGDACGEAGDHEAAHKVNAQAASR